MNDFNNFGVYNFEEIAPRLDDYRKKGLPKGVSTGWPELDEYYTVMPGEFTVVTGAPNAGKSEILDAILVNLATYHDWRFIMFTPENQPYERHVAKIMEKFVGKPFSDGPTPKMTEEEYKQALRWGRVHFEYISLEEPTLDSILDSVERAMRIAPEMKHGFVLDPWNEIEHERPPKMSETEYISWALSKIRRFARNHKAHVWIVAHPAKLQKDQSGKYPVVRPWDISGSAHWFNKADNCLSAYRDVTADDPHYMELYVQKVRFKNVGKVGMQEFEWDFATGRFTPTRA